MDRLDQRIKGVERQLDYQVGMMKAFQNSLERIEKALVRIEKWEY